MAMDLSVIICTHNRAGSLQRVLNSLIIQTVAANIIWELLIIDNASTDTTRQVVLSFAEQLPVRYVHEAKLGKSAALNRAVQEACGELLIFTDDDVELSSRWIQSYFSASVEHSDVQFFGGPVVAAYEGPKPAPWVTAYEHQLIILALDRGPNNFKVSPPIKPFFVGANMAARHSLFKGIGDYDERIGPCGSPVSAENKVDGEEILLQRLWMDQGAVGLYVADAVVDHFHPADRLTEKRLRLMHTGKGIREVRLGLVKQKRMVFGAPLYFWRLLLVQFVRYLYLRPWPGVTRWVLAEAMAAYAWGVITESRKQNSLSK
jgi:glycosyltransferase involved in cell wall biosynthesis